MLSVSYPTCYLFWLSCFLWRKWDTKGGMGIPSSLLLHSDLVSKIIRLFYDVSCCYDPHAIHVVHFDHLTSRVKVHKLDPLWIQSLFCFSWSGLRWSVSYLGPLQKSYEDASGCILIYTYCAVFLLIAIVCVCIVMQYDELVCDSLLACTFDFSFCLVFVLLEDMLLMKESVLWIVILWQALLNVAAIPCGIQREA
jgi:hypothetical protein